MADNSDSGNKTPSSGNDQELYRSLLKLGDKIRAEASEKLEAERQTDETRRSSNITFTITVAAILVAWLIYMNSKLDNFHSELRDVRDHVGTIKADIRVHEESHKNKQ